MMVELFLHPSQIIHAILAYEPSSDFRRNDPDGARDNKILDAQPQDYRNNVQRYEQDKK